MRKQLFNTKYALFLFALVVVLVSSTRAFAGGATIVIINGDGPNEGFNDQTPVAQVGGNMGTTRGQQRLIAFNHAAGIWASTLDSNQTIFILASFDPLGANVLGSAGSPFIFRNFSGAGLYPGAAFPGTWYGSALADKRSGVDLNPTQPDIRARFSSDFNFYLGLDNNHGPLNDLVVVLLHELAHGLGFQNFVDEATGANPLANSTDIYARQTLDTTTGQHWHEMAANADRQASAIRYGRVVWVGPNVTAALPSVLSLGSRELRFTSPAAIAGAYQTGVAQFGPNLASMPALISGNIVVAQDASNPAGPLATDACTPLTNAAAVAGNIALIDRGTCGFAVKAKNAQDAGATAVIIANNAAGGPPGMAGVDPTLVIPTVSLALVDANLLKANLPATANLGPNPSIFAGADQLGRARLYMPNPISGGSSGSHYDTIAFRNLLMEPFISSDLTHSVKAPQDLTLELLRDVGWFPDADLDGLATGNDCDDSSDLSPTVVIDGCDTGVPNPMYTTGCTLSDLIQQIAATSGNHGQFASGVAHLTNELRKAGFITNNQKSAIQSCAARARIP